MKSTSKFINKEFMTLNDPVKGKLSIFGLAIPLFLENVGVHLISMIQTMMSANFMDGFFVTPMSIALSASAPLLSTTAIVTQGLAIILSISIGRHNDSDSKKIIATSLYASLLFSTMLLSICIVFAKPLIEFMGYTGSDYAEQLPYAVDYLRKQCIVNILVRFTSTFITILRCYGLTKIGMYASVISSGFITGATAIMLFVISPAKEHVIDGFIICRISVRLLELLAILFIYYKKKIPVSFHVDKKWFIELFKIGTPAAVANLAYTISNTLTTKICVALNPDAYLARIYINQLVFFVYTLGQSIGNANSIMVGRLCGMGDLEKADKMHRQNLRLVMLINGLISASFIVVGNLVIKYGYNASDNVVAYALPVFIIDVIVEIGRGMNHIGQNGLNATKDVNFTTVTSIISAFTCSVGLAYVFGIVLNLGLIGIWFAFAVDEIARGTLYFIRWKKGTWKKRFTAEAETFALDNEAKSVV